MKNLLRVIFIIPLLFNTSTLFVFANPLLRSPSTVPTITSFSPSGGSIGTLVTINGTGLNSPTSFTIGGANALVISNTGTVIIGMVMPGATTGTVSVSTAGGSAAGPGNFNLSATLFPNTQQGSKLSGSSNVAPSQQGTSVAVSADGNTAIVGGPKDNSSTGAVWFYIRNSGVWTQQGLKQIGTGRGSPSFSFGNSVSISADGNTAIVGCPSDNSGTGAVWVFVRSAGVWSQQGSKLVGTGSGSMNQGNAVSLSADGNTALIGGNGDNSNQGAIWVFTRSGTSWAQQAKLIGTGNTGASNQGFSVGLSADGNTAIEGGYADNSNQGGAWIFTRSGTSWSQQGTILIGTGNIGAAQQGWSVALNADGNTAIVGGPKDNPGLGNAGGAWVYTRNAGVWSQQTKLLGTGANFAQQGYSVSLSADGNTAIVGGNDDNSNQGAIWSFTRSGGVWTQPSNKLVGTGSTLYSLQGSSVSISADGTTAIEGAIGDNSDLGGAWTFVSLNTNAFLSSLSISVGSLSPVFSSATSSYTTSVNNATTSVTITPTTADPTATVTVNGNTVTSGSASSSINLSVGNNTITTVVTAQDGSTTQTYSVVVSRAGPVPTINSFTPNTGAVGTLVTINGTGLTGTTSFTIGGITALVISNTGTILTGYVMPGAVSGNIALTTSGGSATSSTNFLVTATVFPNVQQGNKLVGTNSAGSPKQGTSVAISADGNTALVGGPTDNSGQGAVWVYTRTSGIWSQQGSKLTSGVLAASNFGSSVSLSADGNTALIGGPNDNFGTGAVWIFIRSGGVWSQQGGKLIGTAASSGTVQQGYSVSLSADGNTALEGGNADNSGIGAAWIFTRNGTSWTQQGIKLVGTGNSGQSNQGWSVGLSADGNTAIIGGYRDNSLQGAAWIFKRTGSTWNQQGNKLIGSGNIGAANQGNAVAINADGTIAVIAGNRDNTDQGAIWIFNQSGGIWSQQTKLIGTENTGGQAAQQGFSLALSVDGNTVLEGAYADNGNVGAIWAFWRNAGVWTQLGNKLVGTTTSSFSFEGASVAVSADGSTAIEGGYFDGSTGAAWIFIANSSNALLSGLTTSLGTLSPSFASNTNSYNVSVNNTVTSISVTPISSDPFATITVNGTSVISGNASQLINLNVGNNTISTVVTAQDGTTTQTYSIIVNRSAASSITSFSPLNGPIGTLITVNGTGLDYLSTFQIGSTNILVVSGTSTVLTGLLMPGSNTGQVSVNTLNGSATGSGSFTVTTPTPFPSSQQGLKLVGTGRIGTGNQGNSVAVSSDGNTAIVGGFNDNGFNGAVWIYTRSGGSWTQQGNKLTATANVGAAQFGSAVAISADGNTVIIGGSGDNSGKGAVWVYTRSGGIWSQQGSKILATGEAGFGQFGSAVSLSADGNSAIIGALSDGGGVGGAFIFIRNSSVWTQQGGKLIGSPGSGAPNQGYAVGMSADGNTVIVGAPVDGGNIEGAWIYVRSGSNWSQQGGKLLGTGANNAFQGYAVSISADGNTVAIGGKNDNSNQGGTWVFTRTGTVWSQQGGKLFGTGNIGAAQQGYSTALSADGNVLLSSGNNDNSNQGATWKFVRNAGTWSQQGSKFLITGNAGSANQGSSLSISSDGNTAITGGISDNGSVGAGWPFISLSTNANLSNLTTTSGALTPAFAAGTLSYSVSVSNSTTSVTVTPTTADATATIKVNGTTVTSGSASSTINLIVGNNTITTVVTAQDGTTIITYTITITRAPSAIATLSNLAISSGTLNPVFASGTISYTASVSNGTTSITVTPTTTDATATIKVNGSTVTSGSASSSINLVVANNTITTVVTAQDGTTIITYTITITRAPSAIATLSNLAISSGTLNPVFASGTISYSASVSNATTSITVTPATTDATATIKVNGTSVTSGSASSAINLVVGNNTITTVVTAQDGTTTQTYTVVVNRVASSIATLSNLTISSGTLNPVFASGTTSYSASVSNTTASITVTPTTTDATATIKVNGAPVTSGSASSAINLVVGNNTITTVVTAQDGTTTQSYTVVVNRAASAIATLSNLAISSGTLNPVFASGTISYTASVSNGTTSITVTPTTTDATATIKVNGSTVTSGSASSSINLVVGNNTITVTITAQDGSTMQSYIVVITRSNGTPVFTSFSPLNGGPGTTIIITGNNLLGVSAVNFGGTAAASFTIINATQINAVVAHGQSGNVSLTDPSGTYSLPGFNYLVPLPISFVGIQSIIQNNKVLIKWKVADPLDCEKYIVQHSSNGIDFKELGTVGGNDLEDYNFVDVTPENGTNYYRIISINFSGKYSESTIVNITFNGHEGNIIIYPNPVLDNKFLLGFNDLLPGMYNIQIFSATGLLVYYKKVLYDGGFEYFPFILHDKIAEGLYLLKITGPNNTVQIKKLVFGK